MPGALHCQRSGRRHAALHRKQVPEASVEELLVLAELVEWGWAEACTATVGPSSRRTMTSPLPLSMASSPSSSPPQRRASITPPACPLAGSPDAASRPATLTTTPTLSEGAKPPARRIERARAPTASSHSASTASSTPSVTPSPSVPPPHSSSVGAWPPARTNAPARRGSNVQEGKTAVIAYVTEKSSRHSICDKAPPYVLHMRSLWWYVFPP